MSVEPLSPAPEHGGVATSRTRTAVLLDLDPDLGAQLSRERFAMARAALRVRVVALSRGEWAGGELASISPDNVGLLVLDGVVACEVVLQDTISTELLGAGDLIRPWAGEAQPQLLKHEIRWQVLANARLAILGRAVGHALPRFPEVNGVLIDRACSRAHRLAAAKAISHLNSVDRRLVALFWQLAERWGRVTPEGVVVPLTLSHRLLGELVGARRPTVSTALSGLERENTLRRRPDGTWLLLGEPPGAPMAQVRRVVSHRRRLLQDANASAPRSRKTVAPAPVATLRRAE